MNEHEQTKTEKTEILIDRAKFRIPDCCREGREDCPHCVPRQRISHKKNVGV